MYRRHFLSLAGFVQSVPEGGFGQAELVRSKALFAAYEGAAELHVPRGHRHISEFAHAVIAAELGRRLLGR